MSPESGLRIAEHARARPRRARLHDLDPEDDLCVLPLWPKDRYLELAPKNWAAT